MHEIIHNQAFSAGSPSPTGRVDASPENRRTQAPVSRGNRLETTPERYNRRS